MFCRVTILGTHVNPGLRVGYYLTTLLLVGGLSALGRAFAIRRGLGTVIPEKGRRVGLCTLVQQVTQRSPQDRVDGFNESEAVVPDMQYQYTTLAETLQASWPDLALLFLFNLVFFALAFVRFNKYDVR